MADVSKKDEREVREGQVWELNTLEGKRRIRVEEVPERANGLLKLTALDGYLLAPLRAVDLKDSPNAELVSNA